MQSEYLEKLGERSGLFLGFNLAGDPVCRRDNMQVAVWSNGQWVPIGTNGIPASNIAQDAQGNYYTSNNIHAFSCSDVNSTWDSLKILWPNNGTSLTSNGHGDVVARVQVDDTFHYFRKLANDTSWMRFRSINLSADTAYLMEPFYLCDNGKLYFKNEQSSLIQVCMDIHTGTYSYVGNPDLPNDLQIRPSYQINPDGTSFGINGLKILRFIPGNMPNYIQNEGTYELLYDEANVSGRSFESLSVQPDGSFKALVACLAGAGIPVHSSAVTGKLGTPKLNIIKHNRGLASLITNRQGQTYLNEYDTALYRWK